MSDPTDAEVQETVFEAARILWQSGIPIKVSPIPRGIIPQIGNDLSYFVSFSELREEAPIFLFLHEGNKWIFWDQIIQGEDCFFGGGDYSSIPEFLALAIGASVIVLAYRAAAEGELGDAWLTSIEDTFMNSFTGFMGEIISSPVPGWNAKAVATVDRLLYESSKYPPRNNFLSYLKDAASGSGFDFETNS